jgi:hypothetical protein
VGRLSASFAESQPLKFAPLCLHCRYDLSATPDGRCPECGAFFTHADLAELNRPSRRLTPLMSAVVIVYAVTLFAAMIALLVRPLAGTALLAGAFLLALLLGWLSHRRRVVMGFGPLLAFSGLIAVTPCVAADRAAPEWLGVVALHALALGAASGWIGTPDSPGNPLAAIRRSAAWGGMAFGLGGSLLLLIAAPLWWSGYGWSELDSLIAGGAASTGFLITFGSTMVVAGVALFVLRGLLAKRDRTVRLTPSPSPPPSSSPCPPGSAPPSPPPPAAP